MIAVNVPGNTAKLTILTIAEKPGCVNTQTQ
jgi:hypothetical protein